MITIKQLAKELEISPSIVSIVLNGKAEERKISKATQNLILRAAADRGVPAEYRGAPLTRRLWRMSFR